MVPSFKNLLNCAGKMGKNSEKKIRKFVSPKRWIMVPTGTRKPGKLGDHFSIGQKSENFDLTGKVREFYTKYWITRTF